MNRGIVNLASRAARNRSRYGGKGAGLAHLMALGLDVPPGFAVPVDAFAAVLRAVKPPRSGPVSDEELAESIRRGPIPAPWRRRLARAFQRLEGPVIVRSSLTCEDHEHASLAGQLETIGDVADEDALFAAVQRCFASVFSPRLRNYRQGLQRRGMQTVPDPGVWPAAGLVVQHQQPAHVGGVAFSADPVSGRRCVIIEAAVGRVDGVVSGTVAPTRWVVDARGDFAPPQGGNGQEPPLGSSDVHELARIVRHIAFAREHPIDVEWLHDGGRFWFVQARPITTLVGKRIYSSRLVADMSPGLVKPLLWSTNTQGITRNVFARLFAPLAGRADIDYSRLVRRIHSRLYADVTELGRLMTAVGLPANFFDMMARDECGARPRLPRACLVRLLRHAPVLWRHLRARRALTRFVRDQGVSLVPYRSADWSGVPAIELLEPAGGLLRLHGRSQWFVFLAAFNLMLRRRLLERAMRPLEPEVSVRDLLRGQRGLRALEPNEMLREAGQIAFRLDPELKDLLGEGDDARIRTTLADDPVGRELLAVIDEFMRRYGFLSANGTDFTSPSWVERPTLIWQSVARQAQVQDAVRPEGGRPDERSVAARLPWLRRRLFRRLLTSTRAYLDLRERTSFLFSEDTYEFRRVVLAMGNDLVTTGRLVDPDDVFYLCRDELWRLVGGDLDPSEAQRLVAERRAEMAADAAHEPEETLCGEEPFRSPTAASDSEHLVGIGGSPGTIEGVARIVRDPLAAPGDLGQRDILVVPFTDVGWTPLLAGIGGIVAEAGGQLSHTAIVAREYGLPAVVSVRRATQLLHEGEAITLDGRLGRVYRGHVLAREEVRT